MERSQQTETTRVAGAADTGSTRRRVSLRWTVALLVVAVAALVAASVIDLDSFGGSSPHEILEAGVAFEVPEGWEYLEDEGAWGSPDGEALLWVGRWVHRDATDFVDDLRWALHFYDGLPPGWQLSGDDEVTVGEQVGWWRVGEGPGGEGEGSYRTAMLDVDAGDGTAVQVGVEVPGEATEQHDAEEILAAVADSLRIDDAALPDARRLTVADEDLAGEYWVPDDVAEPGAAIVYFGGSEGGFDRHSPAQLARAGFPTLSLAYWTGRPTFQDLPGIPTALSEVPLEYFESAIRWLAEQPEVDPDRIYVWGGSRGGEAALLLGATYPELIHAVVANAPSNVVNPDYPGQTPRRSGWSLGGEPIPFVIPAEESEIGLPLPVEIPVEDFAGPVLLTCGELDDTWDACPMSRRVVERLEEHGYPHRVDLAAYPDLGHSLNLPAYSIAADPRDGDEAWQRTLAFLDETS